jgi:uncharacterized protein (DUF433 family)
VREGQEGGYRLIGHGVYTIPEAAKLTRICASRIRRCIQGYEYRAGDERRRIQPLFESTFGPIDGSLAMSFLDLVEIRFVNAFLEQGVTWTYLSRIYGKAAEIVGHPRPFSTRRFRTDGRSILTEIAGTGGIRSTLEVAAGQMGFWAVIAPFYKQLDFDTNEASRWWPLPDRKVVIDPQRSFGQPIVARDGIPTRALYCAYLAESKSVAEVACWYGVPRQSVKAAIEFEERLAA